MHASSLENMQRCYEQFICGEYLSKRDSVTVLDIGGANINGSYSDIFSSQKFHYIAADIEENEGVDVVLDNPYKLPFDDRSIDIIISGQAFEHVEFFWLLFEEMTRTVAYDGWIILIAPSAGPIHQFPVDCYRFYPDAFRALAKYAKISAIQIEMDNRGPWNDLVGVFSHRNHATTSASWHPLNSLEANRYSLATSPAPIEFDDNPEIDVVQGGASYLEVLSSLHNSDNYTHYLEIGVRKGNSLALASCKTTAIDPAPDIDINLFKKTELFEMPSDHFFRCQTKLDFELEPIDLGFIDGMHLFEFVLRDFINIEARSSVSGVIIIDDIFPNHPQQASRKRKSKVWTGDVWKILICLKRYRPDLTLSMIDSSPTGCLIVSNLDNNNKTLTEHYNPIVREIRQVDINDYKELILLRSEAISLQTWKEASNLL